MATVRFVFEGWKDRTAADRFHESISYLDAETAAKRNPGPDGMYCIRCRGKGEPTRDAVLEVTYDNALCDPEKLDMFFATSGVAVHHADPFFKPVKSLWQALAQRRIPKPKAN